MLTLARYPLRLVCALNHALFSSPLATLHGAIIQFTRPLYVMQKWLSNSQSSVSVQTWGRAIFKRYPAGVPSPHPQTPSPMKGEGALITPSGACPCALSRSKAHSPTRGERHGVRVGTPLHPNSERLRAAGKGSLCIWFCRIGRI